jgi:hypothetical protein
MIRLTVPTAAVEPLRAAMTPCCEFRGSDEHKFQSHRERPSTFWLGVAGESYLPCRECGLVKCGGILNGCSNPGPIQPTDVDMANSDVRAWYASSRLVLPANVREMLGPCETCGGRDGGIVRHPSPEHPFHEFCPDCRAGHPLTELVTECPIDRTVIRGAAQDLYRAEVRRQGIGWDDHCTELLVRAQHALAAQTGIITLGRVTATGRKPVPIVRQDDALSERVGNCVVLMDDGLVDDGKAGYVHDDGITLDVVTLIPLADEPTVAVEVQVQPTEDHLEDGEVLT